MKPRPPALVLASGSRIRRSLLERAGLAVEVDRAAIDEAQVRDRLRRVGAEAGAAACALARAKAEVIAERRKETLVVGADQILVLDGEWLEKPGNVAGLRAQLKRLSGRGHELVSAAVLLRGKRCLWEGVDRAQLKMRPLSESFIEGYIDSVDESVLQCVGGYQLEERGAQLFEKVAGDFFTVLGLPLLPLLGALRNEGVLPS